MHHVYTEGTSRYTINVYISQMQKLHPEFKFDCKPCINCTKQEVRKTMVDMPGDCPVEFAGHCYAAWYAYVTLTDIASGKKHETVIVTFLCASNDRGRGVTSMTWPEKVCMRFHMHPCALLGNA